MLTETTTRIFKIPVENLEMLRVRIEKLNKKAKKLGTTENKIILGDVVTEKVIEEGALFDKFRDYQYVTVEGEAPVLNGWTIVGKLEYSENTRPIVKSVPGMDVPPRFRDVDVHCEHCNVHRFRRDSIIVEKDGVYMQVGRACLKDFTGHKSPEQLAAYSELLYELEDEMNRIEHDRSISYVPSRLILEVVTVALAAIARDGFRPSSFENSTRDTVYKYFNPPTGAFAMGHVPLENVDKHEVRAAEVIAWIKATAEKNNNDFWYNLRTMFSIEYVQERYFGYVAGAVNAYLKEQGQIAHEKSLADGVVSEAIAADGTKVKVRVTVVHVHIYFTERTFSYYDDGKRSIVTFKTDDHKLIKMFTSKNCYEVDDVVELSGKIEKAEVETFEKSPYRGIIITYFAPRTRVTFVN